MRNPGLGATLVSRLEPFHLKRLVGGADDAGDLHRNRALADIPERIGRAGIVAEKDRAALRREVVG